MPLAIAPCQIDEIAETSALYCFVRERNVRHGSRAARGQLTKSVLDELRAEPEHLQKSAYLLKLVERALAGDGGLFSLPTIGHKRHTEGRSSAADGAMNANCSFVCHVVSSSPFRLFAISFLRCRFPLWPFRRAGTVHATW